jgi:transcriptional regulator with XRE-family HTH domain
VQNMPRTSLKRANQCLINARFQRGWTQREVAEAVGTTLANVSRWERGVTFPSPYFRQKLCEVFEMSPEDLNLTRTQRYSSRIGHTKQKDFPMSHNRFWNVERMFFFLLILSVFIILRVKERKSLLKGAQLHSMS